MYFNNKKHDDTTQSERKYDTASVTEHKAEETDEKQQTAKQAKSEANKEIAEQKPEIKPSIKEPSTSSQKEEKTESKVGQKKEASKETASAVPLVRRDTDNEFEITGGEETGNLLDYFFSTIYCTLYHI